MALGPSSQRRVLAGAMVILAAIVVADVFLTDIVLSASYAVAAVVAGALANVRRTAAVAVLALLLTVVSDVWNDNFAALDWVIRICLTVGLGTLAVLSAWVRERRERDLRHMTVIAETAQRAVLRSVPSGARPSPRSRWRPSPPTSTVS